MILPFLFAECVVLIMCHFLRPGIVVFAISLGFVMFLAFLLADPVVLGTILPFARADIGIFTMTPVVHVMILAFLNADLIVFAMILAFLSTDTIVFAWIPHVFVTILASLSAVTVVLTWFLHS